MYRLIFCAFTLILVAEQSSGLKWIEMTAGDPLPPNVVAFPRSGALVGRARHFDEIHPAEVSGTTPFIKVCGKSIIKHKYEILTSVNPCSWSHLPHGENLPENIVLVGHKNESQPLFLAMNSDWRNVVKSFSLERSDIEYITNNNFMVLVCENKRVWIDSSSEDIPKNAVSGGKLTDNRTERFVARLNHQCNIYPGEVVPEDGIATAWTKEGVIEGRYAQVLIGDPGQYSWVPANKDKFPDNAVIGSTSQHELFYVAKDRVNNNLTYLTNFFMLYVEDYEILVENFD